MAYLSTPRFYHTFDGHINDCLIEFEPVRYLCGHPDEVEMSIWTHDIVYDTHLTDNEERSAQLAYEISKEIGMSDSFAERTFNLVLATKHIEIPQDIDAQILVDIDLAPFGKPPEEFREDVENIRKEYEWVKEDQFNSRRAILLRRFLDRPYIYSTEFFRKKYEIQARKNLEDEIARLI